MRGEVQRYAGDLYSPGSASRQKEETPAKTLRVWQLARAIPNAWQQKE